MSEKEQVSNLKLKLFNVIMVETENKRIACMALCNLFVQLLQDGNSTKASFMSDMEGAWDFHAKH